MSEKSYHTVTSAEDVTVEILEAAEAIADGWYDTGRIDWTDFLERLEKMQLASNEFLDLGDSMTSPAIRKIQAHVRAYRKL